MIKGLPLVEQSYKRNLAFIIPDLSYKTDPPKVNLLSFQISLIRLPGTPPKVNPFSLIREIWNDKRVYLWWSSLIREIWNDKRVYLWWSSLIREIWNDKRVYL
jgi:hypothetical protein